MDGSTSRHDIDDTDYDGRNQKRWYYRLYSHGAGRWFWEPRLPSPAEVSAPHTFGGFSWEPMTLAETEWPSPALRGPYTRKGDAITVAEDWFEAQSESTGDRSRSQRAMSETGATDDSGP